MLKIAKVPKFLSVSEAGVATFCQGLHGTSHQTKYTISQWPYTVNLNCNHLYSTYGKDLLSTLCNSTVTISVSYRS